VGDLIDRGPQNLRTVEIVRGLVEHGDALCLMGNHEFNAVQFHTPDPDNPRMHLRPQDDKNRRQHQAVLDEIERRPGDWQDMLGWFRSLPLAVEGPNWRCVHACWHEPSIGALERHGNSWFLAEKHWLPAARYGTDEFRAVETLIKGPEAKLPEGATFRDKEGNLRDRARLRWWDPAPQTIEEAMLFQSVPDGLDMNAPYRNCEHIGYPEAAVPVFFGHYWNQGEVRPERPNAACLDYSIGKNDRLAAYCFRGEAELRQEGFVMQAFVRD
ncbi:MAG TPA: metallophosphoesterase, partial [Alphaproteobacteria bacterium]|nr:metallophosphoesterase [Alphaproteobacteria bacterium]